MVAVAESPPAARVRELFAQLPSAVLRSHGTPMRASGRMDVECGRGLIRRVAAWAAGMPRAGTNVLVTLDIADSGAGLRWSRTFDGHPMATVISARGDGFVERSGLVGIEFRFRCDGDAVEWEQRGFRVGPLRFPSFLAPRIKAVTRPEGNGWHVDIRVEAPLIGLLAAWRGLMIPE